MIPITRNLALNDDEIDEHFTRAQGPGAAATPRSGAKVASRGAVPPVTSCTPTQQRSSRSVLATPHRHGLKKGQPRGLLIVQTMSPDSPVDPETGAGAIIKTRRAGKNFHC